MALATYQDDDDTADELRTPYVEPDQQALQQYAALDTGVQSDAQQPAPITAWAQQPDAATGADEGYVTDSNLLAQLGTPTQAEQFVPWSPPQQSAPASAPSSITDWAEQPAPASAPITAWAQQPTQDDSQYVSDPQILKALGTPDDGYVTDPAVLAQLGTPDDEKWVPYVEPQPEGTFGTIARKFVHNILPTAAAIGTGALTAPAGPWVAIPAALGAFAGTSYLQEQGLKALNADDSVQMAINAKTNPGADIAGDIVSAATPFGIGSDLALARRGLGAGIGTALEAYGQYQRGEFDPTRLGVAAATGAVFNQPRAGTAAVESAIGAAAGRITGRPDLYAPAPSTAGLDTPGPQAAGGVAQDARPTTTQPTGDLQNQPTRSERDYGKTPPATTAIGDAAGVYVGDLDPTLGAALDAARSAGASQYAQDPRTQFASADTAYDNPPLQPTDGNAATLAPAQPPPKLRVRPGVDDSGQRVWNVLSGDDVLSQHPTADAAYRSAVATTRAAAAAPPDDVLRGPMPGQDMSGQDLPPQPPPQPAAAEPQFRPLGAAATGDSTLGLPDTPSPPGQLASQIHAGIDRTFDIGRDIQKLVAPMATGSQEAMATVKDFANLTRRNRYEWSRIDQDVERRFTPEQRERMWNAADEESVLRQEGKTSEHMGLATLTPEERAGVTELQARAQAAWQQARDLGMVQGEGLPFYTPRMLLNVAEGGEGPRALDRMGANLRTTTPQLRGRKYLTAEETEAAARAKFGGQAEIARDIRALPLATARLEDAIAGRTLINNIRDIGRRTGQDTVVEGNKPSDPDHKWFTFEHPAFYTLRPRMEAADTAAYRATVAQRGGVAVPPARIPLMDRNGNPVMDRVPLYVRDDFEGPLRSVLTKPSGMLYSTMMGLKGKTMSLIMNSPLIHNAVEWGRALPAMPGKVATFKIYFEGNRAKNDPATMREAIDNGLVPIGKRFFNQDISSIMEEPDLTPGRSFTAKVLGFVPGLFDPAKGVAVMRSIDRAGDFWHNTMLWDRVADLQMGLYTNMRDDLQAKGIDPQTSARVAAHWANRYAGALPQEAMSDAARKIANMFLFSRSFTLGNLGVMKDMLNGLPRDVRAQISRDVGSLDPKAEGYIKSLAQRKAIAIVMLDMGLMYIGNSLLQSGINMLRGKSLDDEMGGYADRLSQALKRIKEHPLGLLSPLGVAGAVVGGVAGGLPGAALGGLAGTGMAQLKYLSSTAANEPDKQDRILVGYTKDGTGIYGRNPAGKIGEEFTGYLTGPLAMLKRKLSTFAQPAWQVLANDKGFGRKVYDPNADAPAKYLKNMGAIVQQFASAQAPEGQIRAAVDLATGQGDRKLTALQTLGPVAGVTFSKGAPGGPAQGEIYRAREQHQNDVDQALPDIRRMIQRGEIAQARQWMTQLHISPSGQDSYIRTTRNPAARLTPRAVQEFYQYATPEQRQRFQQDRQRPQ